jgi:hypothetical protein
VCEAVRAHRHGNDRTAIDLMRPALAGMHQLGGSHAQQDVLMQLFLDSAMKADRPDDVKRILAQAARGDAGAAGRVGYAQAVRQFVH